MERQTRIIHGPKPLVPISNLSLGKQLHDSLLQHRQLNIALEDAVTGEKVSYATLLHQTCRLSKSLQKYGMAQNSIIGVFSENNLHYFYPVIAGLYLGITVTTFNSSYTPRELLHCANISKPTIIFCTRSTCDAALKAKPQMSYVKKFVVINTTEKIQETESLEDFISNHSDENLDISQFKPIHVDPTERVAFILYSSGTTGLPKGVMITHKNINVRNANMRDPRFFKQVKFAKEYVLGLLPFYHAYGLVVTFEALNRGRSVVVIRKYSDEIFLKTIQDYKISSLYVVPPLAIVLAKSPLVKCYDLSNLKEIACGAAPLDKENQETVIKRLNLKMFRQGYGMTETTLGVMGVPLGEDKSGSCGKILPYMSAKVVDLNTREILGLLKKGELCFRGGLIMKGYVGDDAATKNTIDEDGWLYTGDVGYYDEDGYFYIIDRVKELIKYKGFQVPPAELEAILLTHPKIKDVGVVGIPDETAGELPLAFVVKQPGKDLSEQEVKNYVAKQVSPQKRLYGGVRFVDEIPKNPSGKILRKRLRELTQTHICKL